MAASANCFVDQSCEDFNIDELLNIDSSLLMSFLGESQAGDGDDEMLIRAMIQSLEPEIVNQDSCSETYCSSDESSEECRFSEVDDEVECCSTSLDHCPKFEWIDMEMDYSCPSSEMSGYYIGRFTENMVEEIGGLEDYSQVCYNEMAMGEEDDYIGLWQ